ncbi:MAG: GNAT family N-acetyltransferase [Ignavibacteria bacterium]|nr:GNAT family N-acetyltransferase [Ignavibacteria bacterium]
MNVRVPDNPDDLPAHSTIVLQAGANIELRELREEDAEPLFLLVDSNRLYLREWLPWVDQDKTSEDSRRFVFFTIGQRLRSEAFTFGLWIPHEGDPQTPNILAGIAAFRTLDHSNRSGEIGYWLAEPYQGKGIMTEACRALVDFGFGKLALHRIVIRCATGNRRSCRVPERLGFRFEGITREAEFLYDHFVDLNVYAMLSHRWNQIGTKE